MKKWGLVLFLVAMSCLTSCAGSRSLIVLLPDSDGEVGSIYVETNRGFVTMDKAFSSVSAVRNKGPEPSCPLTTQDIEDKFKDALSVEPRQRFVLKKMTFYCPNDATGLTQNSRNDFNGMIHDLILTPPIEMYVVGHTDSVGEKSYNMRLSQERALAFQQALVANGVDSGIITISFLGDSNPMIKTPDNVHEPKNRRVEVIMKYPKED